MASRFRSISKPAFNIVKSAITKPSSKPYISVQSTPSSPTRFSRPIQQICALQSLLPLHTAVSSARLTSCLGLDTSGCRSLSLGLLCCANPGV